MYFAVLVSRLVLVVGVVVRSFQPGVVGAEKGELITSILDRQSKENR